MLRLLLALALLLRIALPASPSQTRSDAPSLHVARASGVVAAIGARSAARESVRAPRGERLVAALPVAPLAIAPAGSTRVAAPMSASTREPDCEAVASRARGPPIAA